MKATSSLAKILACFCVLSSVGSGAWAQRQPKPPVAPAGPAGAELQGLLMRFADRSVYAMLTAFDQFHLELDTPEKRAVALERQHFMISAVVSIASQPDPDVALLDMIVLVTLERFGTERVRRGGGAGR